MPLDLTSLRVLVNGADWTARFTVTPDTASYAVSGDDALVAGTLTLRASISDLAGASASVEESYAVHPTLQAISPAVGEVGETVTIGALGLDPLPAGNLAVFSGGVTAEFGSVDRAADRGTVVVPPGAGTGPSACA
jgi:hypothetical protein